MPPVDARPPHKKNTRPLGGEDILENAVVVCPNCHREAGTAACRMIAPPRGRTTSINWQRWLATGCRLAKQSLWIWHRKYASIVSEVVEG